MIKLSFERKFDLVNLKKHSHSFREMSANTGIPKSTIYDNIGKFQEEIAQYEEFLSVSPTERLIRTVIVQTLCGKCSSRDTADTISNIWTTSVSHQTVLSILEEAAAIARSLNKKTDFSKVECAALDEIFQKMLPILVFADPNSGAISMEAATNRSAEAWNKYLTSLKDLGLNPGTTVTDGGKGILKGITDVFKGALRIRDLFHVLQKLTKALKVMEGACYRLITKQDDLAAKNDMAGSTKATEDFNSAATLFGEFEKLVELFKKASYLGDPEKQGEYVDSHALEKIVNHLILCLEQFVEKHSQHRKIKDAMTYLKNGIEEIIAYKKVIEKLIVENFGVQNKQLVLSYICPLIEFINQYQRAHDSKESKNYWGRKIAEVRTKFRGFSFIDQEEIDNAINIVWAIGQKAFKSDSYVESVNSVIRAHLNTYKSIPGWFCPLFSYYWNHRCFARGKRAGNSPIELMTGEKPKEEWLEAILARFPFEKFRSGIPLIPKFSKAA